MHQVRVKTLVLAVAGAICMIQNVHAANQAEVLETGAVDVVSTTPLPSIGTPINEVPANVQTASAKSIAEQRNLDVSEFLDNNLGSVSTSNSVANPYQPDVAFRGFTASPLLGTPQGLSVFMDGVRVNEPFGDVVNWDLLPPNAIASINLVPGSNPVFGLNTLGGALSVNTKSGSEFPGTSVTAYGGSWGRRALEVETGGANADKSIDYFISGNTFKEDGWRDHSKSEVNQLFGKVGWQDEKSDLDLSVMFADTDMEGTQALPRSMLNNRHQAYTYPDSIGNNLAMVNLKGSHFFTDDVLVAGNVYYRHNRITGFNSNAETLAPGDSANISTSTDQDGFGGALQMTLLKDLVGHKNQFTVGASLDAGRTDFTSDTAQASVIGNKTVNDPGVDEIAWVRLNARNDYYGVYATDTFSITDQLHATLSGRYNLAKIHLSGESFDDNLTPKTSDLSGNHRYSRFNPAIGLNYNPSQSLGFYGSYNEGMRAPTPVELSCADESRPCALPNAFAADPHLDMIVSKTWEGGVRGKLMPGLGWNASIYRTVNNNDIQFIASNATSTGFFKNVGDTKRQGVELGLNGKIERFNFAANYGFVNATYQSDFVVGSPSNSSAVASKIQVTKGDKIPGIPRQTLKLRVGYEITSNWTVGSNVVMASGQYARGDENNKDINGKVPGYTVVNLDTHYAINDSWKVFAKINNVFDRDYETFGVLGTNIFNGQDEQFRSPAAPRAGWVGVTYEFGRPKGSAGARIDND